ncbi:MAG: response regulator [Bdellovibrionota bacterium]
MDKESERILIIDDLGTLRMVLRMELQRLGYRNIDEAEDGLSAYALIMIHAKQGTPYSAIVCDWDMPGLTGIELLEKIRDDKSLGSTPFIMLTGDTEVSSQLRAFNAGATDYLIKPIGAETLALKIEQVIKVSKTAA